MRIGIGLPNPVPNIHRKGREFDDAIDVMHRVWRGDRLAEAVL